MTDAVSNMDAAHMAVLPEEEFSRFLKGEEQMYILLDAAVDKKRISDLYALCPEVEGAFLFCADNLRDLAACGPFLARIPIQDCVIEWVQDANTRPQTAIMCFSPFSLHDLSKYLNGFLQVQAEYGQWLLFRFYDKVILYEALKENAFRPITAVLSAFSKIIFPVCDEWNVHKWVIIKNKLEACLDATHPTITHEDIEAFSSRQVKRLILSHLVGNRELFSIHECKTNRKSLVYARDNLEITEIMAEAAYRVGDELYEETCDRLCNLEQAYSLNSFEELTRVDLLLYAATEEKQRRFGTILRDVDRDIHLRIRDCLAIKGEL